MGLLSQNEINLGKRIERIKLSELYKLNTNCIFFETKINNKKTITIDRIKEVSGI